MNAFTLESHAVFHINTILLKRLADFRKTIANHINKAGMLINSDTIPIYTLSTRDLNETHVPIITATYQSVFDILCNELSELGYIATIEYVKAKDAMCVKLSVSKDFTKSMNAFFTEHHKSDPLPVDKLVEKYTEFVKLKEIEPVKATEVTVPATVDELVAVAGVSSDNTPTPDEVAKKVSEVLSKLFGELKL